MKLSKKIPRFYRGESLLALMLSIALSAALLLVMVQFYAYHERQNQRSMLQLQLQTELQRALQTITKDLRRSGFRALSPKVSVHNFALFELDENHKSIEIYAAESAVKKDCVLFFYDLDGNACLGSTNRTCVKNQQNATSELGRELFGYRVRNGILESRTYGTKANNKCKAAQCLSYMQAQSCEGAGWSKVLDEERYEITNLEFRWLEKTKGYLGLEIKLAGRVKQMTNVQYETSAVAALLNQEVTQ